MVRVPSQGGDSVCRARHCSPARTASDEWARDLPWEVALGPLCVKGGQRAGTRLKLQGRCSQPVRLAVWKVDLAEPARAGPQVVGRGFPACHWLVAPAWCADCSCEGDGRSQALESPGAELAAWGQTPVASHRLRDLKPVATAFQFP